MLDPNSTKVLLRRLGAALIDLSIVLIPSLLILKSTVIVFRGLEKDPNGNINFSVAQLQRMENLPLKSISRMQEVGDNLYIFSGGKFLLGILFCFLLIALVYVLVPVLIGSSLGKRLTNLQVVDSAGEPPSVVQYMTRTALGVVDVIPLAWVVPKKDIFHRRIGDRLAGTTVVDGGDLKFVNSDNWQKQQDAIRNSASRESTSDLESMVAIDSRLSDPSAPQQVPQEVDPTPLPDSSYITEAPPSEDAALPDPAIVKPNELETQVFENELPGPPGHDPRDDEFVIPDFDLSSTPTPAPARASHPESDPASIAAPQWDTPKSTPSPVWSLDKPATVDSATEANTSPALETATASLGSGQETIAEPSSRGGGSATDPIWDAGWDSWMFYDSQSGQWLRHDTSANEWVPAV